MKLLDFGLYIDWVLWSLDYILDYAWIVRWYYFSSFSSGLECGLPMTLIVFSFLSLYGCFQRSEYLPTTVRILTLPLSAY